MAAVENVLEAAEQRTAAPRLLDPAAVHDGLDLHVPLDPCDRIDGDGGAAAFFVSHQDGLRRQAFESV